MQLLGDNQQSLRVIEPDWDPRVQITNQEILNALAQHIKRDYRLVLLQEYKNRNLKPALDLVVNRFCSWKGAMQTLGLDMDHPGLRSRSKIIRYQTAQWLVYKRFGTQEKPSYLPIWEDEWKVKNPPVSSKQWKQS